MPFDSEYKLMGTLNAGLDGSRMVMVKGAPDRLLDRCATQLAPDGESAGAGSDRLGTADRRAERPGAARARRRWRPATADSETLELVDLDSGLEFVGMVGIVDPPRPEAIEAIASCHSAGIRVKMITGDHAGTATAIAREMGIIGPDAPPAITGAELERATDEQLQGAGRVRRRVRAHQPRAQDPAGSGAAAQRRGRRHDRRRRQRRARAEAGRRRRGHGHQGHRGHQAGRRHGPGRRQLRHHRAGRATRAAGSTTTCRSPSCSCCPPTARSPWSSWSRCCSGSRCRWIRCRSCGSTWSPRSPCRWRWPTSQPSPT